MAKFTWTCDRGANAQNVLDISEIKFGDQYTHRAAKSINPRITTYSLSFKNRNVTEIDAIIHFLEDRGGWQSFTWRPPDCPETALDIRVVCSTWSTTVPVNSITTLNTTFRVTPL